jgi:1-acyl-sn-glycerol-3-phosphate acyltransferase
MEFDFARPPAAPTADADVPCPVGRAQIRAALRARLPGVGLLTDLALAPIDHLFDHAGSTLGFLPEPACYYANHQTSYESFLIAFLQFAITGVPLLAVTHPGLFDNDYGEHCMLMAAQLRRLNHPAADAIQVVAVPHELKPARDFLLGLPEHLKGRSLLVHVGAWRELHEGQPVNTMSKDLMEVTLRLRRPVVPIRISGGLPAQSLGYKFHLPYRMSRLTINTAPPIEPEALLRYDPLGQRRRVLAAINGLAPPAGGYVGRPNTGLMKRCLRRHVQTGSSALKCFLMEAVETMPDPSRETELLRDFIRLGVLPGDELADAEWFARQAMWISDGRGLKTV